jgi:hypothetical protein
MCIDSPSSGPPLVPSGRGVTTDATTGAAAVVTAATVAAATSFTACSLQLALAAYLKAHVQEPSSSSVIGSRGLCMIALLLLLPCAAVAVVVTLTTATDATAAAAAVRVLPVESEITVG